MPSQINPTMLLSAADKNAVWRSVSADLFENGRQGAFASFFNFIKDSLDHYGLSAKLDSPGGKATRKWMKFLSGIEIKNFSFPADAPQLAEVKALYLHLKKDRPPVCEHSKGAPKITGITRFSIDMEGDESLPQNISSAAPLTMINILGENFILPPSANTVRIGGTRCPVVFATNNILTTVVPLLYNKDFKNFQEYLKGEVQVVVETPNGQSSAGFTIDPIKEDANAGTAFSDLGKLTRRFLAAHTQRLNTSEVYLERGAALDETGAIKNMLAAFPFQASKAAQLTDILHENLDVVMDKLGERGNELKAVVGGALLQSGILEEMKALTANLESSDGALLRGSGFVQETCKVMKHYWEMVVISFIAVLVVLVLACICLEIVGPGWVMEVILIPLLICCIIVLILFVLMAVISTIIYLVVNIIDAIASKVESWWYNLRYGE